MDKLRKFREEIGMSQEELAKKTGVSRVTISMLETGNKKNITVNTLSKLAEALHKNITDFF